MISLSGKVSCFGGASDEGMKFDSGLAAYEPKEADLRPDIFCDDDKFNPGIPTWKRLRITSMYCALRYNHSVPRKVLQMMPIKIVNPLDNKFVMAWTVDLGPHIDTKRLIDVSPGVMAALSLSTDDTVRVEINTELEFLV